MTERHLRAALDRAAYWNDTMSIKQVFDLLNAPEEEHGMPEVQIIVNGMPFTVRTPDHFISYEQVALLAGKPDDVSLTVTYELIRECRPAERSGTLRPGRSIDVEDGMMFDAVCAGNA